MFVFTDSETREVLPRLSATLSSDNFVFKEIFFRGDYSRENTIRCFNEHNEKVIADCPKDKLLIYEVGQGWEPLCAFLGKPVPDVPFPNLNDSKEFKSYIKIFNAIGAVTLVAAAAPFIGLALYLGGGLEGIKLRIRS